MNCNACGQQLLESIYRGSSNESITTMNTHINGELSVYLCKGCGHCQTLPLNDLKIYYENEYELGRQNEEDDQLYSMGAEGPIYRAQHQATVLLQKLKINTQTKLLDFGCGKSLTMRRICSVLNNFKPFVYDVTDRYLDLWLNMTNRANCAVGDIPKNWSSTFDVVTSFYALEHIEDLQTICLKVRNLLKESGRFYFIIPDMISNPADFIVADHVNHFSRSSLSALMGRTGFIVNEIDFDSHYGAIICTATKSEKLLMRSSPSPDAATMQPHNIDDEFIRGAYGLAEFWSGQDKRITHAIRSLPSDEKIAIYGAGFYGTYLLGLANKCNRDITCFIDSNPHLIGGDSCGLNVISPTELPSIVKTILVGLNPSRAKEIIKDIDAFKGAEVSFIYIE